MIKLTGVYLEKPDPNAGWGPRYFTSGGCVCCVWFEWINTETGENGTFSEPCTAESIKDKTNFHSNVFSMWNWAKEMMNREGRYLGYEFSP